MSPDFKFVLLACLAVATYAHPPLQHEPPEPHRFEGRVRKTTLETFIEPRYRLPGDVIPVNYNLRIRPVLTPNGGVDQFRMPGTVIITVECVRPTNVITMHADELRIDEESVTVTTGDPGREISVEEQVLNSEDQSYEIVLGETLTVGTQYDVRIVFDAYIAAPDERMNGIYRSSYVTDQDEVRIVATTQFSRTRALRKTFPSFDEPNQKATFEFEIGRTEPYRTLSNMDLAGTRDDPDLPGWVWDRYAQTVRMPGTVIAFVISDFDSEVAPPDLFHPDKPVAVWGPPPALRDGAGVFAAEMVARILRFFEGYFGIEYEFPKMDSVGMPDFAAGAMENWGLNIYRTSLMFWYQGESLMSAKYSIGDVIAHELAHQWWGNLVTHAWWNDWWLTEGTASYFEYIGFDAADAAANPDTGPQFQSLNRIVCDDLQPALDYDAGANSVPIHGAITDQFVENPSVINYQKGASLVRMMQSFLGEEAFIGAMSYYLNERRYQAVHQEVFFDELTTYLEPKNLLPNRNTSMKDIMETWTMQPGYPLLRVSRGAEDMIFVSQERFRRYTPPGAPAAPSLIQQLPPNDLWYVPVGYVTASNPDFSGANLMPKFWINKDVALTMHALNTNEWLVLNGDARGYYRVLYDDHFETLLRTQLLRDHNSISVGSRSQLLDDYFALAFERYIRIERALEFTRFLRNERDHVVWVPVFKHLRLLSRLVSTSNFADPSDVLAFHAYIRTIVGGAFNFLGGTQWPDEAAFRTITRVQVLDWACMSGHVGCVASAVDQVDAWRQQPNPTINPVPVDIQPTIYCTAIAHGDQDTWNFFLDRFKETLTGAYLNALACSTDESILSRLLSMSIEQDSDIPSAFTVIAIQRVAMNTDGRELVLQFLEDHVSEIIQHSPAGVSAISQIVSTLSQYIANPTERTRLATFISEHSDELEAILPTLNGYLGAIDAQAEWVGRFGENMITWMKGFNTA